MRGARCAGWVLAAAWTLAAQTPAPRPPAPAPSLRLWWSEPSAAALGALTRRQDEVNSLMDEYDIGFRHWSIHELRCSCVRSHWIYQFVSIDAAGSRSEFVLLLPADGGLAPGLIPLLYDGSLHRRPAMNLQNIALFNRMMAEESFHPGGDADWIRLALVYLALMGDQADVIDPVEAPVVRAALPRTWALQLPLVSAGPNGQVRVRFDAIGSTAVNGRADASAWQFSFDAGGHLRALVQIASVPFSQ